MSRILVRYLKYSKRAVYIRLLDEIKAIRDSESGPDPVSGDGKLRQLKLLEKRILNEIEESEKREAERKNRKGWDLSKEKGSELFVSDGEIELRPLKEKDRDFYLTINTEWLTEGYGPIDSSLEETEWAITQEKNAFYCLVVYKGAPAGSIFLKDTSEDRWEVGIDLIPEYRYRGIGGRATALFMKKMHEITGREEFRALAYADNTASHRCLEKMGAKLAGLHPMSFDNKKETEGFRDENTDLITPEIISLAEKLEVKPEELLVNLLDYRIIAEDLQNQE